MTDKEIARALGLSPHTVSQHIRDGMARLGVSSRKAALRALTENPLPPLNGMVPPAVEPNADLATADRLAKPEVGAVGSKTSLFQKYAALGPWREPPRIGGSRLPYILGWACVGMVVLIVFSGLMSALFGTLETIAPGANR